MNIKLMTRNVPYFIIGMSLFLAACSDQKTADTSIKEAWSNDAEVLFQKAEVLKHSLEEIKLEDQKQQEFNIKTD